MALSALTPVPFYSATLLTTQIDGTPYVALNTISDAIGLKWNGQWERIKRHPVLSSTIRVTRMVAADGKTREVVCLPLDKLNGWLFGVTASRTRPEIRERLIQYQRECFDVLAGHFMPKLTNCTNSQSSKPALVINPPALDRQQVAEALGLSLSIAGWVQQVVARAVMNGGDDWKHERWLVSFVTDSKLGSPPVVERLDPQTRVMTPQQISHAMQQGQFSVPELLELAMSASCALHANTRAAPKGWGDEVARKITTDLPLADLHRIATAATTELMLRVPVLPSQLGAIMQKTKLPRIS